MNSIFTFMQSWKWWSEPLLHLKKNLIFHDKFPRATVGSSGAGGHRSAHFPSYTESVSPLVTLTDKAQLNSFIYKDKLEGGAQSAAVRTQASRGTGEGNTMPPSCVPLNASALTKDTRQRTRWPLWTLVVQFHLGVSSRTL